MDTIILIHLQGRKSLSNLWTLLFQSIYKAEKLFQTYGHYHSYPFTRQQSSFKLMDTVIPIHLQGRKALSKLYTIITIHLQGRKALSSLWTLSL